MSINPLQGSPSAVIAVANASSNSLQTSSQEHPSEPGKITDIIISLLGRENIDGFAENIILENVTSRGRDIHRRCIADRATLIEKLRFPVLQTDLVFYFSNKYLDERSAGSFNVAAGLNRKEAIRRNNALAADELCKIANSRECSELFAQILSSRSLSSVTKLDSIKSHLRSEVRIHRVGFAQIEFADKLVAELDNQFPGDVTLNILKTSINAIKALKMTQTEQANAINAAIIFRLNSKDYLKKALDSLVLSNTKLKKMLPHTDELSNEQVLKLDFNIESANSIISFVELSRKTLIAQAQIEFADMLIAELERQFPGNETLNELKESIGVIKESNQDPIGKANKINEEITCYLKANADVRNRVESLNFSSKNLKALSPCIGEFPNIERLDLSYNQLTVLPGNIGKLTNLRYLNLEENQLTALPNDIGKLTNLVLLVLSYNQLTALPDDIGGLISLGELSIIKNQLTILPESIGRLINLEVLDLSENQITVLPEAIKARLKRPVTLNLRFNSTAIPNVRDTPSSLGFNNELNILDFLTNRLNF